jgi:hypothetical protein
MRSIEILFVFTIILSVSGCIEKAAVHDKLIIENQYENQYVINGKSINYQSEKIFVRLDNLALSANLGGHEKFAIVPFNKVLHVNEHAEGSLSISKEEWPDYHIFSGAEIDFY